MDLALLQTQQRLCSLCFTQFKEATVSAFGLNQDARVLDCGHAVCLACAGSWQKSGGGGLGWISCPVCAKKSSVSKWTGVKGLKKYRIPFTDNSDVYANVIWKAENEDIKCTSCSHGLAAVVYCKNCNEHLCDHCSLKHSDIPAFTSHDVISVASLYAGPKKLYCKAHDRVLEYYCKSCKLVVCQKCVMQQHGEHRTESLDVTMEPLKTKVGQILHDFRQELSAHNIETETTIYTAVETLDETESKIRSTSEQLIHEIKNEEEKLLKLVASHKAELKVPRQKEEQFNFQINAIHRLDKLASQTLASLDPFKLLELKDLLAKRLKIQHIFCCEKLEKIRPGIRSSDVNILKFSSAVKMEKIGDLVDCNLAVLMRKQHAIEELFHPDSNSKWLPETADVGVKTRDYNFPDVRSLWSNDMWGFPRKQFRPLTSCTTLFSGEILATESQEQNDACKMHLFSAEGSHMTDFDFNAVQACDYRNDSFAFTDWDNKCITVVSLATKQVIKQLGHGLFVDPVGISFTPDHKWIVTDDFNKTVNILDEEGKLIRTFGGSGRKHDEFLTPHYVTFDPLHRGRILVSDSYNDAVKVFDTKGKFLCQIFSREPGNSDGQLHSPRGIASDPLGQIIVADSVNDRVSLFSPDAKFISHLLTAQNGVKKPHGVAVDNMREKMAVTNASINNSVNMYKLVY